MKRSKPYVIGLIGGSGTGKTHLGLYLKEILDAEFIEADKVGHLLINEPPIVEAIVEAFGEDVRDGQCIDRKALGTLVFGNQALRLVLNKIMHSAMYDEIQARIMACQNAYVVFEAAVMIEAGFDKLVDEMVLITASDEIRLERLTGLRGINRDKALSLIGLTRVDLETYADDILDTSCGLEAIKDEIDTMVVAIKEAYNETHI